jgi:hypothetical protein
VFKHLKFVYHIEIQNKDERQYYEIWSYFGASATWENSDMASQCVLIQQGKDILKGNYSRYSDNNFKNYQE